MHEAVLHRLPRRSDVLREQFLGVGISLRREGAVAAVLAALVTAVIATVQGTTGQPFGVDLAPETGIPMALLALLVPMAVWKGEDPTRRGYHRAMPVGHGEHAVMRALAGLPWVLGATAAYFTWMLVLSSFTAGQVEPTPLWQWWAPFAGVTVLYLLGSALTLRVAHPWRWMGGGLVGYMFVQALRPVDGSVGVAQMTDGLLYGPYGIGAVVTGNVSRPVHEGFGYMAFAPSFAGWLLATWLWVAVAISLFLWSAYRQPES
jgi:hypothetical protein